MDDELTPSAVIAPRTLSGPVPSYVTADGRHVQIPAPMVASVGDIAGISPKRARGDTGEVPGADIDLIDALGRDREWPTVAAWLTAARTVSTRRARLADTAAFLRWLNVHAPGVTLLTADEDTIVGYRESIATGRAQAGVARPGMPLAAASIARRISTLSSLYVYAMRRAGLARNPASGDLVERPEVSGEGKTPARTRTDARALLSAGDDPTFAQLYPADAAAVALLLLCALRAAELAGLTVGQVLDDSGHRVLLFTRKGGKTDRVPVPLDARPLLEPPLLSKTQDELVFVREDGRPWDRWRFTTALRRAANAVGVDHTKLTPHTARATVATELLDEGVAIEIVQDMLGHASPVTTQRYNRGTRKLAGHGSYRMAAILAQRDH